MGTSFDIGDIGKGATVLVGEHLVNVSVQVTNAADAEALVERLRTKLAQAPLRGPLRALEALALTNRTQELSGVRAFFESRTAKVLYIHGLAGTGKSTLARAALEFRSPRVHAVWVNCQALDATQLLMQVNAGLELKTEALLRDNAARIPQQIAGVLGAIREPSILVLDQLEFLLDAEGRYESDDMSSLLQALAEMDHRAKVLVTSRVLPAGPTRGGNTSRVLRLGGLTEEHAMDLFRARAGIGVAEAQPTPAQKVVRRLEGNPKFIELLALALDDLTAGDVFDALLDVTDIGRYLVQEILSRLNEEERQVLHAACVFRSLFPLDALRNTYKALYGTDAGLAANVRRVVQRALLEATGGSTKSYTMHGLISDALPADPAASATAHAAAADWFLRDQVDARDSRSWDDGLYHLRRAAEANKNRDNFERYCAFIDRYDQELMYNGFGQRLIEEKENLLSLSESLRIYDVRLRLGLAVDLANYDKGDRAMDLLARLHDDLDEFAARDEDGNAPAKLAALRAETNLRLAQLLADRHEIDRAKQLCAEVEGNPELVDASRAATILDIKFRIARAEKNVEEMDRIAMAHMEQSMAAAAASSAPSAKEELARSHEMIAHACMKGPLSTDRTTKSQDHFMKALKIYVDIGKLTSVANGLFNAGVQIATMGDVILRRNLKVPGRDEVGALACAYLLTSEQIHLELGLAETMDWVKKFPLLAERFLSSPMLMVTAANPLPRALAPYFMRGLERRMEPELAQSLKNMGRAMEAGLAAIAEYAKATDPDGRLAAAMLDVFESMTEDPGATETGKLQARVEDVEKKMRESFPSEEAYREQVRAVRQQLSGMAEQWLKVFQSDPTMREGLADLEKENKEKPPNADEK